ncbi:hypothetical protein RRF57_007771 [Xylaria bambusicola]|uniref:Protein-lysine N-methyltransferase EFM4 n=1 Tax=Xylaria bambusicola TaxID=326684 RepID=A0AAN7Z6J6_9PEZI
MASWDALYTTEIANHAHDPTDTGTAWFDDSDAEAKLLEFLEEPERAQEFGLDNKTTSFLDLGTGNGALLFALRDNGWEGPMLGVDYSAQSVRFARRIERARRCPSSSSSANDEKEGEEEEDKIGGKEDVERNDAAGKNGEDDEEGGDVDVHFAEHDILHGPATALLDEQYSPSISRGWDVVLDKGTFDAISLSAETIDNNSNRRVNEAYGTRILPLVREGGLFLITSCNWTEAELKSWFEGDGAVQGIETSTDARQGNEHWGFEVVGRVEYRSFSFGGVKGQTISSLCFQKVRKSR